MSIRGVTRTSALASACPNSSKRPWLHIHLRLSSVELDGRAAKGASGAVLAQKQPTANGRMRDAAAERSSLPILRSEKQVVHHQYLTSPQPPARDTQTALTRTLACRPRAAQRTGPAGAASLPDRGPDSTTTPFPTFLAELGARWGSRRRPGSSRRSSAC